MLLLEIGGGALWCLVADIVGVKTCYSIVSLAEKAGIVGFKRTRDLVSSEGIIYASSELDTVGLLTRRVSDVTPILEAITHNPAYTESTKINLISSVQPACPSKDLTSLRISLVHDFHTMHTTHPFQTPKLHTRP